MRIAYLTQPYPPMVSGVAIVAEGLANEMAQRGHTVLVIAASETEHPYTVEQKNLTILRLASIYNPLRVGQRFLYNPRRRVLQALKEFQPDVIHTHDPLQLGWAGLQYAGRNNIPITLTTHQLPWFVAKYLPDLPGIRRASEAVLWAYAGGLLQRFTSVISPTQTISKIMLQMTGLHTQTINYGINLQSFRPGLSRDEDIAMRARLNIPPCVPIILHVGRLDTDKSVDLVIHAAAEVIRKTDAHLLLIGDGREKPILKHLCKSLGVESRVHFAGYVSCKEDLCKIYSMASLFVTASEIETQGIVLIEAMASGLPIVAVNATCIPEVVHDGLNGYLVEPGDVDGLTNAICKVLNNSPLAKSMSQKSRNLAKTHDIQNTFDRHEKLYHLMSEQRDLKVMPTPYDPWRYIKGSVIPKRTRPFGR